MMKILIGVLLLGAIASLFSGLFFLVRDRDGSQRTVRALTIRVGFCVALVALVVYLHLSGQLAFNPSPLSPAGTE